MNALGWRGQRRRVGRLSNFVRRQKRQERRLRHVIADRSLELFARLETMFLIGATGAVWTTRLKSYGPDEKKHPVFELFDSVMVVRRWKWFAGRVFRKESRS